jgi:hypothetical protein
VKVAIGANRKLRPWPSGTALLGFLRHLTPEDLVMVRSPASGQLSAFETVIWTYCHVLEIPVQYRAPDTGRTPGRASVFARDIEMVAAADLVVLLMTEEEAEGGYSGTYHLYEQALQQDRPVYVWIIRGDLATRWGEHDPEDRYAWLFA